MLNCKESKSETRSSNKQSLLIGLVSPLPHSCITLCVRRPLPIRTLLLVNLLWGTTVKLEPQCTKTQCDIVPSLEVIEAEVRQNIHLCTTIEM